MKRLQSLTILPERDVGTKDMPEWTEEEFARAIRLDGRPFAEVLKLYRVRKAPITARIDQDVLQRLKGQGEGYQTHMNTILHDAVLQSRS